VVQAPAFIRGINPKLKIENPQAPAFIRGVNRKSKIENRKSIDWRGLNPVLSNKVREGGLKIINQKD
jgi:hypothetical protein